MRAHQRKALQAPAPSGGPAPARSGPSWDLGPGAWERGAAALAALPQPVGLVGEAGLLRRFRRPLTGAWLEAGVHLEVLARPDGEDCSLASRGRLLKDAQGRGVKALLGFGGGRMLDLAKAAAWTAGWPVATAPSSAATAAAGTAVAVLNREGAFHDILEGEPPVLALGEVPVLARAPSRLLAAGLADTLAKWLEWRALEEAPPPGSEDGWALARRAALAVRDAGVAALAGDGGALDLCLRACLPWSAAASNAGRAPAAAAHSLANALSRQAPGRALLHGEAVGLGLLWQEALLNGRPGANMGEPLRPLLASWGLPTALPGGLDLDALLERALAPEESAGLLELDPAWARDRRHLPLG